MKRRRAFPRTPLPPPATLLITLLLLLTLPNAPLQAAEWHRLTRTAQHEVAVELEALERSDSAIPQVLLRFTPRGEKERLGAAKRYGHKNYALHLELHEIDCTKRIYRLLYQDILGWRGNRLARIAGSGRWETIAADSVLGRVAELVCTAEESGDQGEKGLSNETATELSPQELFLSGEALQRINAARKRVASSPDDFEAWVELGNAWYDADMPDQAIQAYDRALAIRPNDANVLNDRGAMYRQKGDSDQALENFQKALAIDPHNLESLYNLGYVYAFDLNRADRAREAWQRYLRLDSSSEQAEQVRSFMGQLEKPGQDR